MAYAFVQDVPIGLDLYRQIRAGLGEAPPAGLVVHVVIEQGDRGLRYVDVWESEEAWTRFQETRLHPVVGPTLARAGVPRPPREPERQRVEVADVWIGSATPPRAGG
jgi:hypothetical protein